MNSANKNAKKEYTVIKAVKRQMSQMFAEDGKVTPLTNLELKDAADVKLFSDIEPTEKVKIAGISKGRGFAGTVKRWGFRGGPRTHGQIKHRSPGSIGTQGDGRVMPGRKMPGRFGTKKITTTSKVLAVDTEKNWLKVSGAIPGSQGQNVAIYLKNKENNEN